MDNSNQDLLDLCQLNQLRDANDKSVLSNEDKERDSKVIDWKIRQTVHEIIQKSKGK